MGKYTKEDAIKIVTSCAEKYKENLAGKCLLFVCLDKHQRITTVEFSFDTGNFLHLTGLKIRKRKYGVPSASGEMSAKEFFRRCLTHRLSVNDFDFSKDGTTQLKLQILPKMVTKNLSATMVADFHSRNPKLLTDKLAGSVVACMGFVSDSTTAKYVPNTILMGDIRNYGSSCARVIAVFRKRSMDRTYCEATYFAKNIDWYTISYPKEYGYLPKPTSNDD